VEEQEFNALFGAHSGAFASSGDHATGVICIRTEGALAAAALLRSFDEPRTQITRTWKRFGCGGRAEEGRCTPQTSSCWSWLTGCGGRSFCEHCAAAVLALYWRTCKGWRGLVSRGETDRNAMAFRNTGDHGRESGAVLREVVNDESQSGCGLENAINEKDAVAVARHHRTQNIVLDCGKNCGGGRMAALSQRRGLPLVEDLGSGCICRFFPFFGERNL